MTVRLCSHSVRLTETAWHGDFFGGRERRNEVARTGSGTRASGGSGKRADGQGTKERARVRSRQRAARAATSIAFGFAAVGSLALAAPAAAENVHVPTQTITGFTGNPFNTPRAVAVDNSSGPNAGDVYVVDNNNYRVDRFSPTGEFLTSWGKEVNEGTGDPNICSNAGAPANICKPGVFSESSPYGIGNSFSIAVDPSSGPSQGDIYVNSGSTIQKFDPTGHLVTSFGGTPFPGAISISGFESPAIAVDSSGILYVIRGNTLSRFSENGAVLGTVTVPFDAYTGASGALALEPSGDFFAEASGNFGPGPIKKVSSTGVDLGRVSVGTMENHGLAYDPGTDELLAAYQQYPVSAVRAFRFNGSDEVLQPGGGACALGPSGCGPSEEFANEGELNSFNGGATGVGLNTANHTLYVADTYNSVIRAYRLINVPKVTTGATEDVTRTSVRFLGHVDPDGAGEVTSCRFEYGTTKEYELGTVPCQPATTAVATDVSAELPVGTLTAQTQYYYRLVAGNANGDRPGAGQTFNTLGAVIGVDTNPAVDVQRLSAQFNGVYTGDDVDTSFYFEYGPTEEYGQKTEVIDDGARIGFREIAMQVSGLYAYYSYHYRFVAENEYGVTAGSDQTFHTLAPALPSVEKTFASSVDPERAIVNAEIDPGEGLTVYRFEYGSSTYGSRTLVAGPIDPNELDRMATAELSGLASGTTYHFRVIATNFAGTTFGPDQTFTTPSAPVVASASASGVTRTAATLNAMINPGFSLTTYHFDYGTSASYGSSTRESGPLGPDSAGHATSAALDGLAPGTLYHFRAVASNAIGTTFGVDETFTTQPPEAERREGGAKRCKKGFRRRGGRCVRRKHRKRQHRGHRRHARARHG
jgi:hypothetical protein